MRRRLLRYAASVATIGVLFALAGSSSAFAYGRADQPIAQVEISANCDNPSFGLCQEVGLGGVWAWAELDTAGGNTTGGSMDYTLTFCGHAGPGGGPHGAGAFGHPGEGSWHWIANIGAAPAGAFPFFDPAKYDGSSGFYVLDFQSGTGPDDFIAVVPGTYGHYTNPGDWPPGAQFQTEVAP